MGRGKKNTSIKVQPWRYIGPDVPRLDFPHLRFAFRPALLTPEQITGIMDRYPRQMSKYFTLEGEEPKEYAKPPTTDKDKDNPPEE